MDTRTQIHVTTQGAGVPVVLLHGSASSSRQWTSLAEHLEQRFQVIRVDLPGYGKSAGVEAADMAAILAALAPVMDKCPQGFHLVGHSFGGAVALNIARRYGARVRSLTVIEPVVFGLLSDWVVDAGQLKPISEMLRTFAARLDEGDAWAAMAEFSDFWNGAGSFARSRPAYQRRMAAMAGSVLRDGMALDRAPDSAEDFRGIACPVMILDGADSPTPARTICARLADAVSQAVAVTIPDAGHMLPLTDPHIVDPMIAAHLCAAEAETLSDKVLLADQVLLAA